MSHSDPFDLFLPPVARWFREALGEPTPAQRQGWPLIAAGQHTLILAPTGSGKTLAAFLACLDNLWRAGGVSPRMLDPGVRVLYVSPLKALNNDIYRNLQLPLEGIAAAARAMGQPLPQLEVAVRTGDTPPAERQRFLRRPAHVLITTPESLHLLLTSRARDALRTVTHCIVDEIHALCPNKRGVFLSLLLERLEALQASGGRQPPGDRPFPAPHHRGADAPRSPGFVRIGLSATQRPLDEVARYLGGLEPAPDGTLVPRPVEVVNAGLRKDLDLRVLSPVDRFGPLPEHSVWPSIYRLLGEQVRQHRSTIVFANNRRAVERITVHLNEAPVEPAASLLADETGQAGSLPHEALPIARAHHGSIALEVRQDTERALKEGRLPAVVATASLELGIDMGAVDLVCQVESPGNVARALQRVGRAGHLVGKASKGRLIAKTPGDLIEQAVLAREMSAGRVEAVRVPINCLDVLAQQIVAMAAVESQDVPALYALVRRAYPYRDLSPQAFEAVLEMVSGRYRPFTAEGAESSERRQREERTENPERAGGGGEALATSAGNSLSSLSSLSALSVSSAVTLAALQPRVSWDRVHNRVHALPGSRQLALVSGGTIPDTGQYAAYSAGGVRVGELDEEFIYERRVGDTFLLGTNAWRLERIDADRVILSPAEGMPALVPFWRGENVGRSADLGLALGGFLRELAERIDTPDCVSWLERDFFLDPPAARNVRDHVRRQLDANGCLPTDRTLVIEASRDQLGDWQVILLSPLGSRLHLALRLALEARLRQRLGYRPQCLHHDDGILIRLADSDEPVLDLFDGLTPENVERLVLDELADSALFALRFRQNAARALLLPRLQPSRRAPLWLQRLRGRDLLQVARKHADFPLVAETFRECLHDHLELPRLQQLLTDIREGRVEVAVRRRESASAFAQGLLFAFNAAFMYQYDRTDAEPNGAPPLDRQLLEQLVAPDRQRHLIDPRAVHQVERRLRGVGRPPRSAAEMAEWLRRLGDLSPADLEGPMEGFLAELEADGRAVRIELPGCPLTLPSPPSDGGEGLFLSPSPPSDGGEGLFLSPSPPSDGGEGRVRGELRWVLAEDAELYRQAFADGGESAASAAEAIVERFLRTHALVGLSDLLGRYPLEEAWARRKLEEWSRAGRLVRIPGEPGVSAPGGAVSAAGAEPVQWSAPENLEQVQRTTLALMRQEAVPCAPQQYADFLLRWQGAHPAERREGPDGLAAALDRLQGLPLPAELWEQTVLPARVPGYQSRWLDEQAGEWAWACRGEAERGPGALAFWRRENLAHVQMPACDGPAPDAAAERVLDCLRSRGASFVADLAHDTELPPSGVRAALWVLLRGGLVTNDHFDVVRRGEEPAEVAPVNAVRAGRFGLMRPSPSSARRRAGQRPEGRWSLVRWGHPEREEQAVFLASLLLHRYGVVARELALLDPTMPPWRVLYEVLSRMELAGEVRRGYFVEGLSGAQFALPEAARLLQETHTPSTALAPVVLLHSLDPANLYGSGAPFNVPLLDGGTRPLLRRAGNWLVLKAGRPVLLVEQQGKRLTALASASRDDVAAAVACLPGICSADRGSRHKLTVEEWNGRPVTGTEGKELLEAAGFVRDYQGMTLYAAWQPAR